MMDTVVRKCEVCHANLTKYRCPKCSVCTCSLACVKLHKTETKCNGVRKVATFVKQSEFDEFTLLSDYRFLEAADRCVDNALHYPIRRPRNKAQDGKLPGRLHRMVTECWKRGTCLMIMPENFKRRKHNTTFYNHKNKEFLWNIELDFPQAETKYSIKNVSEKTKLGQMLEPYLSTESVTRDISERLCFYLSAGYGGITPLMKVERIRSRESKYLELDFSKTIMANLVGKTIVEFPTIVLVLSAHRFSYPLLGDDPKPKRELEDGEIDSSSEKSDGELPSPKRSCEVPLRAKPSPSKISSPLKTVITSSIKLVADYSMSDSESETG